MWWIWLIAAVAGWFLLGKLWKSVIQPFFREEVVDIRISVSAE
jgi:hypothetical protein